MYNRIILNIKPLGFMWNTLDPFLFCVHHLDHYPAANDNMGPAASLRGRNIGQDFTVKDGWRMYHGETVPGFPAHPHRGFETVTVVLNGLVDHSDSHGAAGRYGNGDVQWMTAGAGLQHSEMFPLLNRKDDNPLELFQIWLNLPAERKFAKPHYAMLWAEDVPVYTTRDESGKATEIRIVAGRLHNLSAPPPAPDSWAANPDNDVVIWVMRMEGNTRWTLPASSPEVNRILYFYKGSVVRIAGIDVQPYQSVELMAGEDVILENGVEDGFFLLLQGRPISEPVVQHGPFVMNTGREIQQAIHDYHETRFGGWPWPRPDMVHGWENKRFAKYANGMMEER